ncbi:MAG: PD-(D/E)XK nuclease family protein [Patescibacteria group bacterium]
MAKDKYSAVWVSHTSLSDFLKCPRGYYLRNVYKDPHTRHKIQIMSPPLALGQAVHEVLESLSVLPTDQRFRESLLSKFEKAWQKVSGKRGGFSSMEQEERYRDRGEAMMKRAERVKGPLSRLAVKIKQELPYFWLSEEDNIILCGKIDWLEYFPETDSVSIIDFKTSKTQEDTNSLQLPIYHLLVHYCQQRAVTKASYWYLEMSDELQEKELPDLQTAFDQILQLAKKISLARKLNIMKCPNGAAGCMHCQPFERILNGEGELVHDNGRNDIYVLPWITQTEEMESEIL